MNFSQEQFEQLIKALSTHGGATGTTLVFTGILACVCMQGLMWFILNLRLAPYSKLEERLNEMQKTQNDMNAKLWTQETLDLKIENKIHDSLRLHEKECKQWEN